MRAKTVPEFVRVSVCERALDLVGGRASQHDLLKAASRGPSKYPYRWIYVLFGLAALAILFLNGCAGFVSGANTSPTQTLTITNVQATPTSTSAAQIVWSTNVPADSSVDYGTSTSYGSTTPVDSTMVTSHQVVLTGLVAGTTYYYQVNSTDTKSNHGKSGPHSFATNGFSISGTITPTAGGSGATVTLSGASSASTKANGTGAFSFTGLPTGSYTLTPSNTGYTFTPASQSVTISTSNVTGANFTATASTVAPTITTQPASQTVTAGQTATFMVVASGTAPLSYQWQKNGANISGATSSSYTTPATTTSDSGSTFDVVVSNSAGNVTSNAATLTVNAAAVAPTITTQPASQTVTAGQTATFTVAASGTAPLSYQWQKNGANISGATSSSYTTPATATSDSGSTFRVVVSNSAGSATSNAATLTVNPAPVAPTITTQPASQTVTAGQTATFSVVASGTAPLSYQWQKNGANISGATSSSYMTPATTTSDSGSTFDVVVSNSAGTTTSAAATLTVNAAAGAPTITTQPAGQTVTAGQTATFSVVASGTAPLSYQWQKNGANISGATSSSYTTPATTTSDSGSTFDVVVSNSAGNVTSNAATLRVNAAAVAPTITTQPASQTVTAGQTATFTVVAGGTAPLSYQWQKNGANIPGATSSSYTTPATATSDSGSTFDVVVSNSAGNVTSSAVTLTVNAAAVAPTITTQPASQTVTVGQTATFTVVAGGTAPLSYQWQKNGANIPGATSSSYTTPATATSDSGSTFDVVVSNSAGNVTSSAVTLTVNAPAINASPNPVSFGSDVVGTTTTQALIIKNTGTATLSISQITASGAPFSVSGFSLPLNLNAGQQTTVSVAFVPASATTYSGNLSITSNAPGSPTSVSLSGTGIAATLTLGINPTSLNFGNITTGTTSAAQTVTITNTGNSSVTISQITLSGASYAMTGGSAPVTLSPSQNITLSLTFAPTVTGAVSGSISIVSNATGSPATVTLSGTGVLPHSVSLTWNASASTVAGYNVYRSTLNGSGYVKINTSLVTVLSYTDLNVQSGTTYYYVTTAVDSSGTESAYSNQATAVIP